MLTSQLPTPSIGSLAVEGGSVNHSAISSVLALLGWQDQRPVITQAAEAERDLADNLQTAYAHYLALSDQSSVDNLNASLTAVIEKLEKDRATATQRAKEALDHLTQETADHMNGGITAFIGELATKFKILLGSDDVALVEHYNHLAIKYTAQLEELIPLRKMLQHSSLETATITETTVHSSNQRKLLQATAQSKQNPTEQPVCYRFGAYRGALSKDYSGFTLQGEAAGDLIGSAVSTAGDINGDGFADILVGAPGALSGAGKSYILFGSRNSTAWGLERLDLSNIMDGQRGFELQGEANDNFGSSVNTAGDINGDGLADILVGAPLASSQSGKSYVIFGSRNTSAWGTGKLNISSLLDGRRGFVLKGEAENDQSGFSVSSAGDINGDGLADILVGAPGNSSSTGKSYVVFGSRNSTAWGEGVLSIGSLMEGENGFVLQGEMANDGNGVSVSTAGDINGDGLADILVGAPYALSGPGKSYIIFGSRNRTAWEPGALNISSLINGQRGFMLQGGAADGWSGVSVSTAGDINGDGLADILVGAPYAPSSGPGGSYVVFGSRNSTAWGSGILNISSLIDGQRGFVLQGEAGTGFTGISVSAAGDINGDGLADILIGAQYDALSNTGRSYIVLGSKNSVAWGSGALNISSLMDGQRGFVLQGKAATDLTGNSVSTAGDINGDGLADILIGAPSYVPSKPGKSYLVFGSPLYFIANSLRIKKGESIQLNTQNLAVATTRSDIDINMLGVTVKDIENGYFMTRSASSPVVNLTHFYMQNISDGIIYFVHAGGVLAPKYTVVIDSVGVSPFSICSGVQVDYFSSMNNQFITTQNVAELEVPLIHRQICITAEDCNNILLNDRFGFGLRGEESGDLSGLSVSTAGDINGDGLSDILVGAPYASSGAGKSYVVFGSRNSRAWKTGTVNISSLANGQRGFVLEGDNHFGYSISSAGDINGDGLADILVGGFGNSSAIGKSYLIFGSRNSTAWESGRLNISNLLDGQRGCVLHGETNGDFSGYSVSAAGDFNGDGLSDILIGAPGASSLDGKSYLLFGSSNSTAWWPGTLSISSLMDGQRGFVLQGEAGDHSGYPVSTAGDVNGDGLADILVGAYRALSGAGKSYIVFGSHNSSAWGAGMLNISSLMDGKRGFLLQGEVSGDHSGWAVSTAGDINGDGLSDILVGARDALSGLGKSYAIFGSRNRTAWMPGIISISNLIDGERGFALQGEANGDHSGCWVSTAGDTNGDGLSDILVGALDALAGLGKAYVVFGSRNSGAWGAGMLNLSSLMDGKRGFALQGEDGRTGNSVSTAGDINGDGLADILVGAPYDSSTVGKSYVVFGISFPFYFTVNSLPPISAGETVQLNSTFLAVASTRLDIDVNTLSLTIENLTGGYFTAKSAPTRPLTHFYIQNISTGSIQFVHTGGGLAPQYTVVIDAVPGVSPYPTYFDAQIDFLGYPPNLINNQLTVNQGLSTLVRSSDLSASSPDDSPNKLLFVVGNLTYGQFTLLNVTTNTTTNASMFSYQDVLDKRVRFVHDGSRNVPSYNVMVANTKVKTNSQEATINFNYAPEMNITSTIILDQGQATTLHSRDISATDVQTSKESLILEVTNFSYGYFAYASDLTLPISTFQQSSMITSMVQYVHDGSNSTPTFTLRAFDGILYSPWQSPRLQLNHRPVLQGKMADQDVIQDDDFSFSLPLDLFSDPDNDTLTYSAQLKGGAPLPFPEIRFTPPKDFTGNLPTVEIFTIEIQARDKRNVMTSINFALHSHESNWTRYKGYYTSGSGIAGGVVTLLTYLWFRRRVAHHRRDFLFANALRKALNLEYHDFMRFDGDTYKTKIGEFIMRLQLTHEEFYTHLTPQEQKSFAVCVGEILLKHDLVTPSGCASGLYGLLFLLSVGWSLQLDMKKFEAQSASIVREAATEWKQCDQPKKRWPYYSPTIKDKIKAFCCAKPSRAGMFASSLNLAREDAAPHPLRNRKGPPRRSSLNNESPLLAVPIEHADDDNQPKQKGRKCSMM